VAAHVQWLQGQHRQDPPQAQAVELTPGPLCQGDEP
jgi:hypothetical protein